MDRFDSFTDNQEELSLDRRSSVPGNGLPSEDLEEYKALLKIQAQILDDLFHLTEDMLKDLHLDAGQFVLDKYVAENFLNSDMTSFIEGEEEPLDLVYNAEIEGVEYKTIASASCVQEKIEINVMLCRFDDEKQVWTAYTKDGWAEVPDEYIL